MGLCETEGWAPLRWEWGEDCFHGGGWGRMGGAGIAFIKQVELEVVSGDMLV